MVFVDAVFLERDDVIGQDNQAVLSLFYPSQRRFQRYGPIVAFTSGNKNHEGNNR